MATQELKKRKLNSDSNEELHDEKNDEKDQHEGTEHFALSQDAKQEIAEEIGRQLSGDSDPGNMRLVSGDGPWKGKLAVTDRGMLELYVQNRIEESMSVKEVEIKQALGQMISQTLAGADVSSIIKKPVRRPGSTVSSGDASEGESAGTGTGLPAAGVDRSTALYRLEWHHECSNLRCYDERCRICSCSKHACGVGGKLVQPPPVAPYASAYWRDKPAPPAPEKSGGRQFAMDASAFKWHLRAKCGQVVMVRVVNAATGEPLLEAPEGMKLVASLLGPYYEKESTHDVTFAKEDWTSAEFEQNKRQGPEPSISFPELQPLNQVRDGLLKPSNFADFVTNEAFAFNVSNTKGWKFRLGIQAVGGADAQTQPNGRPWSELMLKSEMFEVHNIRSKNDRAPDILSGLNEDVKLLKGVGRRAVEDLQKEGIQQVRHLLEASEDSTKRAMLARILKKEMHSVLAHARTAVPPPLRAWTNPERDPGDQGVTGMTFCAEFTDRFGRLIVNFPLQILLSNRMVYRVTDHELAGNGPMLPPNLEPIKNASIKKAEEDWLKAGHPNWSHMPEVPTKVVDNEATKQAALMHEVTPQAMATSITTSRAPAPTEIAVIDTGNTVSMDRGLQQQQHQQQAGAQQASASRGSWEDLSSHTQMLLSAAAAAAMSNAAHFGGQELPTVQLSGPPVFSVDPGMTFPHAEVKFNHDEQRQQQLQQLNSFMGVGDIPGRLPSLDTVMRLPSFSDMQLPRNTSSSDAYPDGVDDPLEQWAAMGRLSSAPYAMGDVNHQATVQLLQEQMLQERAARDRAGG